MKNKENQSLNKVIELNKRFKVYNKFVLYTIRK